jgi:DNA-binding NarL/FixJ family response regulator
MKRILIVEDIAETRRWLCDVALTAYPEAKIETARNVQTGQTMIARHVFDLALIDLGLPDGSGLDILRAIRDQRVATVCVVTTVMSDDSIVVSALSAGADGYLLKENPAAVLAHQLQQIASGIPALSPPIARRIMEHFRLTGPANTSEQTLTSREIDVLTLIARGLRNAEVAETLGLADSTIAGYIKSVYRKLGISSRAEAAWHATLMGLTTSNRPKR